MERLWGQVDAYHKTKCRICCQDSTPGDELADISKEVQERFMTVTQMQLVISDTFSSKICSICDFQLIQFCSLRDNMIGIQDNLAAFADQQQFCQETESQALVCGTDHSNIIVVTSDDDLKPQYEMEVKTDRAGHRQKTRKIKPNSFRCDLCDFCSGFKVYFSRHIKQHESGIRNVCRTCHEAFASQSLLSQHRSKAHKAKVHLCDSCGKGFNGPSALEVHRKSQHAERELPCHYCDKLFASQKHLNKHLKYHEGKKFVCEFEGCGKGFILNSLLTEHSQTHSNIKNFHCVVCSKSFFLKRQLRKHVNGVHSAKSYACDLCAYSNCRRDNLRTHYYRLHNLTKDEVDKQFSNGFE